MAVFVCCWLLSLEGRDYRECVEVGSVVKEWNLRDLNRMNALSQSKSTAVLYPVVEPQQLRRLCLSCHFSSFSMLSCDS